MFTPFLADSKKRFVYFSFLGEILKNNSPFPLSEVWLYEVRIAGSEANLNE